MYKMHVQVQSLFEYAIIITMDINQENVLTYIYDGYTFCIQECTFYMHSLKN